MQVKIAVIIQTLILSSLLALGQLDSTSYSLIKNIIEARQDTAKIYYVDSVIHFIRIADFKKILNKRKYSWNYNSQNSREINLTGAEKKAIFKELNSLENKVWETNLFPNSTRVSADSFIRTAIDLNYRNYVPPDKRIYKQVWQFCKPIFFRNNSFAIVQIINLCGNECGEDEVSFYKNIDGQWKRWIRISGGVF